MHGDIKVMMAVNAARQLLKSGRPCTLGELFPPYRGVAGLKEVGRSRMQQMADFLVNIEVAREVKVGRNILYEMDDSNKCEELAAPPEEDTTLSEAEEMRRSTGPGGKTTNEVRAQVDVAIRAIKRLLASKGPQPRLSLFIADKKGPWKKYQEKAIWNKHWQEAMLEELVRRKAIKVYTAGEAADGSRAYFPVESEREFLSEIAEWRGNTCIFTILDPEHPCEIDHSKIGESLDDSSSSALSPAQFRARPLGVHTPGVSEKWAKGIKNPAYHATSYVLNRRTVSLPKELSKFIHNGRLLLPKAENGELPPGVFEKDKKLFWDDGKPCTVKSAEGETVEIAIATEEESEKLVRSIMPEEAEAIHEIATGTDEENPESEEKKEPASQEQALEAIQKTLAGSIQSDTRFFNMFSQFLQIHKDDSAKIHERLDELSRSVSKILENTNEVVHPVHSIKKNVRELEKIATEARDAAAKSSKNTKDGIAEIAALVAKPTSNEGLHERIDLLQDLLTGGQDAIRKLDEKVTFLTEMVGTPQPANDNANVKEALIALGFSVDHVVEELIKLTKAQDRVLKLPAIADRLLSIQQTMQDLQQLLPGLALSAPLGT